MNRYATRLVAIFVPVAAAGALALGLASAPAEASITGNCKDVELKFVNGTSGKIDIPSSGHQMKNPGSVEGWNSLTLGASKGNLAAGDSWSNTKTLSIKCVTDAEFKFKWSDSNGDHVENFSSVNISDKKATFTLR
jgi:hypothetical protein